MIEFFLTLLTDFIQTFLPEAKSDSDSITTSATIAAALVAAAVAILGYIVTGVITFIGDRSNVKMTERHAKTSTALQFESTLRHNEDVKKVIDRAIKSINKSVSDCRYRQCGRCKYVSSNFEGFNDLSAEDFESLKDTLNEWERAGNGVYFGVLDGNLLYGTYGSLVIKLFEYCLPFLTRQQRLNPRNLIRFTRLAIDWEIRRRKEEGRNRPATLNAARKALRMHHWVVYSQSKFSYLPKIWVYFRHGNADKLLKKAHENTALYFIEEICEQRYAIYLNNESKEQVMDFILSKQSKCTMSKGIQH